jgi:5-methyltetrahydrofolate--homocysteine methyltransferase
MRERSEKGVLQKAVSRAKETVADEPTAAAVEIDLSALPPTVPFLGAHAVLHINPETLYPYLNEIALIRGRWGFRRGSLQADEYQKILQNEVRPKLEQMKRDCRDSDIFKPRVAYGYFRCRGEGETLWIYPTEAGAPIPLRFPRQRKSPFLSIPDFFRRDEDVVGFMVVTLHKGLEEENIKLLAKDRYQDYFLLHGFAVELTDALAEYWHAWMRKEMGFADPALSPQDYVVQKYRGSRYGFGYPSCPDLSMNKTVCEWVHADQIEVSVTENYMLVPEVSTSALIAHHPKAKYFNV